MIIYLLFINYLFKVSNQTSVNTYISNKLYISCRYYKFDIVDYIHIHVHETTAIIKIKWKVDECFKAYQTHICSLNRLLEEDRILRGTTRCGLQTSIDCRISHKQQWICYLEHIHKLQRPSNQPPAHSNHQGYSWLKLHTDRWCSVYGILIIIMILLNINW